MSLQILAAVDKANADAAERERQRQQDRAKQSRERPGHPYDAPEHPTDLTVR